MMWRTVLCMLVIACVGDAAHFRYGTVGYNVVDGTTRTVKFTVYTHWRRSYSVESVFAGSGADGKAIAGDVVDLTGSQPIELDPGDGTPAYPLKLHVTSHSDTEDFIFGMSTVVHTYAPGQDSFLTSLRGCCRQSLSGAHFNVQQNVVLSIRDSLMVAALPTQTVYTGSSASNVTKIYIPANTRMGVSATYWRMAQGEELGGAFSLPSSSVDFRVSDYQLGLLSVDTTSLAVGMYPVVIAVSAPSGAMVSYDFTLNVQDSMGGPPPTFVGKPFDGVVLEGVQGYEVYVTLTAHTMSMNANMSGIRAFALPQGAVLSRGRHWGVQGDHTYTVDFRWTPTPAQVGGVFAVCVEALDTSSKSSGQSCFQVRVLDEPGPPFFATPMENTTVHLYMLTRHVINITAFSNNPYETLSIAVAASSMLENGQQISPDVLLEGRVRATDTQTRSGVSAVFSWEPGTSMGGYSREICFIVSESLGKALPRTAQRCLYVHVERCKYTMHDGDTLKGLAQMLQVDWLTLWGLNTQLATFHVQTGTEIMIGRMYTVEHGDSLLSISRELGASVSLLRMLNYDLVASSPLQALPHRSEICVFPNTCAD